MTPDELIDDEGSFSDHLDDYRLNVFNLIMDRILQSLELRFTQHKQLYKDLSCFDPGNFKTIAEKGLKDTDLMGITKLCPQINKDKVLLELLSLASNKKNLKLLLNKKDDRISNCNTYIFCSSFPPCFLKILASNRLHDKVYDNLYEIYKVICTLSITQVQCERTFSKLNILKTRLRNSLSEENFESLLFLSIEKGFFDELDTDAIIDKFAQSSNAGMSNCRVSMGRIAHIYVAMGAAHF